MKQYTIVAILLLIGVSSALFGYQMLLPGTGSEDVPIVLGKHAMPISAR